MVTAHNHVERDAAYGNSTLKRSSKFDNAFPVALPETEPRPKGIKFRSDSRAYSSLSFALSSAAKEENHEGSLRHVTISDIGTWLEEAADIDGGAVSNASTENLPLFWRTFTAIWGTKVPVRHLSESNYFGRNQLVAWRLLCMAIYSACQLISALLAQKPDLMVGL